MTHTAWVGKCLIHTQPEADEPHKHPWNTQCYAAVWTETYDGFTQAVRDHCQAQGHYLVWAEQVLPILDWLHRHGHHNTLIDLAKTVDGNHGIALSPLLPRGEAGQPPPQPTYLEITELTIPPLPDQSDQPRWEQDWIVPELKDLLFGQPDPQAPLRTYLIVDATLRTRISGIFDLDLQDVPVRCLVRPEMAEDLREVAPYLVDMTLPEGAWDDRRQVPNFHIDFFAHHWQQSTGILVRTTADMDAVWTHFHPFVRVQVETTQEWLFFRFWDPRIILTYFDSIKTIPEKSVQWINMCGANRIEYIINNNQTETKKVWVITPEWDRLRDFSNTGHFILSNAEIDSFKRDRRHKYEKRAITFFRTQFPQLTECLLDDQLNEIVSLAYKNAKKSGITAERDHFKYLIIIAYWGSYFTTDIQYYPALKKAGWISEDDRLCTPDLTGLLDMIGYYAADLNKDLSDSRRILAGFERIYTNPPEIINYDSVSDVLYKIWPTRCQRLGQEGVRSFIRESGNTAQKQLYLIGSDLIGYIALTMYFGIGFAHDPLYPWAKEALAFTDADERRHKLGEKAFGFFELIWKKNYE